MGHHLSGLELHPYGIGARSHIADFYAFHKPEDPNKTILIVDVNPFSPTMGSSFDHETLYEVKVDGDGDAVADVAFRVRFSPLVGGSDGWPQTGTQTVSLYRVTGKDAAGLGDGGEPLIQAAPVSFGPNPQVTRAGDYALFAGIRSDPFFADFEGAQNNFQFTGTDFFIDKNVFGIVFELPNQALGPNPQVGLWAQVVVPHDGQLVQADRLGRPGIDATFNQSDEDKRTYNLQQPTRDRELFHDKFAGVLQFMGHYPPEEANQIASVLLPDIMPYDYSSPDGPENGRNLTVDSIDAGIALITRGAVPGDGVGPHTDLLSEFPYMGHPH